MGTVCVCGARRATVKTAEGDFDIARSGLREAMNGDEVQVSLVGGRGAGRVAYVQGVLRRATTTFLGTYSSVGPLGAVVALDARVRHDFFVLPDDKSVENKGVCEGDIVLARIVEYPTRFSAGVATIERRVGDGDDVDRDMEAVVALHDLPTAFSDAALEEAASIVVDVGDALAHDARRKDLRDHPAVTIDPADARDFDDAICAHETASGFVLEVHIADVSHYVAWNSGLDIEARHRACSAYLADRVIPMLPEKLSNDACSLRPGEDRLCMSVLMLLASNGAVKSFEVVESAICSKARLSYGQVDAFLGGSCSAGDLGVAEGYEDAVAASLGVLDKIAALRAKLRSERGAIDFETKESKVQLDETGKPVGVVVRRRTRATSLVEEAMLLANECVAGLLADNEAPAAYRAHESPLPESLEATVPVLREVGGIGQEVIAGVLAGEPHAIRRAIELSRGTTSEFLVNSVLLRAQRRAVYLPHNEGHYALGARAYCHFTSPIRRYPDVIVHRALKATLAGGQESREQRDVARQLPQLCRTCSERERAADAAARDSQKIKMAQYYASRIGGRFSGIVVGCTSYGLFVMLDETCAEGMLRVRNLGDEWFLFDEKRLCLTGEESKTAWRPGKRVAVEVASVDVARGHIDFVLAGRRRSA